MAGTLELSSPTKLRIGCEDEYLSPKDFAVMFHCSVSGARKIFKEPGFPSATIKGRLLVRNSDLKKWWDGKVRRSLKDRV